MHRLGKLVPVLLLLLLAGVPATAAAPSCRPPDRLEVAPCPVRATPRGSPGDHDFLMLSYSWSPAFCAGPAGARSPAQCRDNAFGWVVHGLWPQRRDAPAPQYCRPVDPVPAALLRRNFCTMPDARLQQCQWAKHGSCMGAAGEADTYFGAIADLAARVNLPDPQPGQPVRAFAAAVAAANPTLALGRENIEIISKNREITEIRLCFDRRLEGPVACRTRGP